MIPSQALRHPWLRRRLPRAPVDPNSIINNQHISEKNKQNRQQSAVSISKLPPAQPPSSKHMRRTSENQLDQGSDLNRHTILPKIIGR